MSEDKVKAESAQPNEPAVEPEMPPLNLEDEKLPQTPKLKKNRKWPLVIALIVVVLVVGGGAYWYFKVRKPRAPAAQSTSNQTSTSASDTNSSNDVPKAENTESFTSSPYRLTFKYPKTWTVTENRDNSILVQTEDFSYKAASGESVNGNFRLYIRKGGQQSDSDIIAKGVAIEPSSKLVYANPTPVQRTETNLSLFGLDDENNFAFLLITGNFELKKGDTLGPSFGMEAETYIIGGGFSETGKEPGMATNPVPVDGFQDTNAYQQALAIIESMEIT